MILTKIAVTVFGSFIIGFIYWFFFGKKESEVSAKGNVSILVDGGYSPQVIRIKRDQSVILFITRKDPNTCLEEFIIPDFKIKEYLPLNKTVEVEIKSEKIGEYPFHCGMNMFHGKVVVE